MDQESRVDSIVTALRIERPEDWDMRRVAQHLQIRVFEADFSTVALCERRMIFLRRGQSACAQREQLAHEIAHVELHCGGQALAGPAFVALQERQAEAYARKLLMPRCLLQRVLPIALDTASSVIQYVAWTFGARPALARRRLSEVRYLLRSTAKVFVAVLIALDGVIEAIMSVLT